MALFLADRLAFGEVITGHDLYARRMALSLIPVMICSVGAFIIFRSSFTALQRQHEEREATRQEHMRQLEQSYESLMYALVAALDTRDHLAKGHSRRVVAYALAIADLLGISPADKQYLSVGGYLHDVGKIGVNDAILRKEASLTEAEWAEIRRHPQIGHEILNEVEFLGDASDVVLHHHERFDGHGYPTGLAGDKIPLIARVFAVADALDAMTADRPYRTAMSYSRAREVILEQTGTQFCPTCVKAFLALSDEELARIRKRAEEGRS